MRNRRSSQISVIRNVDSTGVSSFSFSHSPWSYSSLRSMLMVSFASRARECQEVLLDDGVRVVGGLVARAVGRVLRVELRGAGDALVRGYTAEVGALVQEGHEPLLRALLHPVVLIGQLLDVLAADDLDGQRLGRRHVLRPPRHHRRLAETGFADAVTPVRVVVEVVDVDLVACLGNLALPIVLVRVLVPEVVVHVGFRPDALVRLDAAVLEPLGRVGETGDVLLRDRHRLVVDHLLFGLGEHALEVALLVDLDGYLGHPARRGAARVLDPLERRDTATTAAGGRRRLQSGRSGGADAGQRRAADDALDETAATR